MKVSETVRLRVDRRTAALWRRKAKSRKENLSQFIRASTNAACADLVTSEDWKRVLLDARRKINLAQHVRTDEQKNERIGSALEALNIAIEVLDVR